MSTTIQKPSTPKGVRDFSPVVTARRNYIFNTIRSVFSRYGYQAIQTPALENLSTLMGKYGEEGDKLLFRVLNSGDFLQGVPAEVLVPGMSQKASSLICDRGLRYDLTVPFARYVVQHRAEIQLPFKRYQIDPVWRADRPQKGRYREFYQCDADVVGTTSLMCEVELLQMIDDVFAALGINVAIKLNNRKVLAGIAELIGAPDRLIDITVAIDKIDKIGLENVQAELAQRGLSQQAIETLTPILQIDGDIDTRLAKLRDVLAPTAIGTLGVDELTTVVDTTRQLGLKAQLDLDVSLARGLNYYTGCIIEVKALDTPMGSISGGGRYDNLTGIFGMPDISGVGISFGADRIYDVMEALGLFPQSLEHSIDVIFLNLGDAEALQSLKIIKKLRAIGISCELYPDASKMKKQMTYASNSAIPFVAIIGSNELENGVVTLKNMDTGEQQTVDPDAIADIVTPKQ